MSTLDVNFCCLLLLSEMNGIWVVAAVGFKVRRPEIPSTVNRHVAAIIESCWASANEAAASFHCITANMIDVTTQFSLCLVEN
ncbi:hypothetical protein ZIOFF_003881 [Zingiber officinale]|uniref:Uncharacterized protein n=1 Tax=Zingiber officinale TaxID=94328 RepID=A0A8J5IAC0_ZINOF|nr:hypothetical protein ZIOFF_003881 [Zingiber officinale]